MQKNVCQNFYMMGSSVSKIADEINLHGSWEAYCAWRDRDELVWAPEDEILLFQDKKFVNLKGRKCQVVVCEKVILK